MHVQVDDTIDPVTKQEGPSANDAVPTLSPVGGGYPAGRSAREQGPGNRYLIQHSGAWLALQCCRVVLGWVVAGAVAHTVSFSIRRSHFW